MGKTALILEGGALRTFYTMGVLDALLEENIKFDYVCGVSGGALCGMNYLANEYQRTMMLNLEFLHDKRYKSINSLWKNHAYFNLDFLFSEELEEKYPFDYNAYQNDRTLFEVVATDVVTGKSIYFPKPPKGKMETMIASATVPFLSEMVMINDKPYLDGGISDAIPYQRAYDLGFDKLVVVMTQDKDYRKSPLGKSTERLARHRYRDYPAFVHTMLTRYQEYNFQKETILSLEENEKVIVIQPKTPVTVTRLESNKDKLKDLYNQGYYEALEKTDEIIEYLK